MKYTVSQVATLLGRSDTQISYYARSGLVGPESVGMGFVRKWTPTDIEALRIVLALSDHKLRPAKLLTRDALYRAVSEGTRYIAIQRSPRRIIFIGDDREIYRTLTDVENIVTVDLKARRAA